MDLNAQLAEERLNCKAVPLLFLIGVEVAKKHGFSLSQLRSERRFAPLVVARSEYYYRALSETDRSPASIGFYMGGRERSSVIQGVLRYCFRRHLPIPRGYTWEGRQSRATRCRPHNTTSKSFLYTRRHVRDLTARGIL